MQGHFGPIQTCAWQFREAATSIEMIAPDYYIADGILRQITATEGVPEDGAVHRFLVGDTHYEPGHPTAGLIIGPDRRLYVKD